MYWIYISIWEEKYAEAKDVASCYCYNIDEEQSPEQIADEEKGRFLCYYSNIQGAMTVDMFIGLSGKWG